ncbi:hypothetical protein [Bacillus wiedmannii]|nr:hypothetical protein [Bacillus wiedmannii]
MRYFIGKQFKKSYDSSRWLLLSFFFKLLGSGAKTFEELQVISKPWTY